MYISVSSSSMYQMPPPGYPVAPAQPQPTGPCGQNPSPTGTAEKRVLYVGNLAPDCTEQILVAVFAQFGECLACKIIRGGNPGSDNYAFMELGNHQQAQIALTAMNRISLMGRELRVNWATAPGAKPDPSKGHHVFVGDLVPDIEESEIMDVFVPYGPILECKIIRHQDGGFKTYAFLTYENETDATSAISAENGNLLRFKPMRVSWASRRNNPGGFAGGFGGSGGSNGGQGDGGVRRRPMKRNYDDVYNETTLYNTSVYFGGIQRGLTEALVRENFSQFGTIHDVKVHEDKGFAFIRFDSHDAATQAIVAMHGATIEGFTAKLGWGKEGANSGAAAGATGAQTGVGPSAAKNARMDSQAAAGFPAAPQLPAYNDPAYQKYYAEYMEWYNKYSGAYFAQQQQMPQQPQAPPQRPAHPPPMPPTAGGDAKKEKAK
ncbi:hypothetical protein BOX15_Mlig001949g1 [Macrostomum lignano]|uniref:RRM domain-containing protein n=1 Tax=Macrostomum lignano TaxID=282301 RepID=A0A267EQ12_9PLAT|nr:hypothetical protein BOX15_Mlig001949g1 [Macrostomum lignano]